MQVAEVLASSGLGDLASEPESAEEVALETLALAGGPAALLEAATEVAQGPLLPELIITTNAIDTTTFSETDQIIEIIAAAIQGERRPLMLGYLADALLASPAVVGRLGGRVEDILRQGYKGALVDGDGHAAYKLLETLVRLALTGLVNKYRVLADLSEVSTNSPADLIERVPRLIGVAADVFGENDLVEVLEELLAVEVSESNAAVELAIFEMRTAFEQTKVADVLTGLRSARQRFTSATTEEGRDDAELYGSAIDAVLAFSSPIDFGQVREAADAIEIVAARRTALLAGTHQVDWARARGGVETELAAYVVSVRKAADDLERASWLQPYDALERVLQVYRASRAVTVTIRGEQGVLREVVEPTIEAEFIKREGLLTHLRDALTADQQGFDRDVAQTLLQRIEDLQAGGHSAVLEGDSGKVLAVAPTLAATLGVDTAARVVGGLDDHDILRLEQLASGRQSALALVLSPIQQDILSRVRADLQPCEDYRGQVAIYFDVLVETTLKFLSHRADVSRTSGGERVEYLFADFAKRHPDEPVPHERRLQTDFSEWLGQGPLSHVVDLEVTDVASGRADIRIGFGGVRFLVEVKRETERAAPVDLRSNYAGQAAAYTGTSAGLGMLLVLDLTDHTRGFPSLRDSIWVDVVPIENGSDRYLVVCVVRGNRVTPSQTRGPQRER